MAVCESVSLLQCVTGESSEESLIELPVEGAGPAQVSSATAPPLPLSMMPGIAKAQPRVPAVGVPVRPSCAHVAGRKDAGILPLRWERAPVLGPCSLGAGHSLASTLWRGRISASSAQCDGRGCPPGHGGCGCTLRRL